MADQSYESNYLPERGRHKSDLKPTYQHKGLDDPLLSYAGEFGE